MKDLKTILSGGDRRSLGRSASLFRRLKSPADLDKLFRLIYSSDRTVAMRAIDSLEKLTRHDTRAIQTRGAELMNLARNTENIEIKWHIAQMLPRIKWTNAQFRSVFALLNYWLSNPNESKIVRANALEAMYNMCRQTTDKRMKVIFRRATNGALRSQIPSLSARAKKLLAPTQDGN